MDDMISLTLPQAIQLRGLYQARKEVEEKIHFGEQMLGVGDREIVSGDLGDENPHLMLRPRPSAIISYCRNISLSSLSQASGRTGRCTRLVIGGMTPI